MKEIVIIGAGAIGRGFLPWVIDLDKYKLTFVDSSPFIIEKMREQKKYSSFMAGMDQIKEKVVPVANAFPASGFSVKNNSNPCVVFMNVGPRNCAEAAKLCKGVKCPIIMCENDPATTKVVKNVLNSDNVYFAVPDVITSNTASEENTVKDPLAIHTEAGELFVDKRAKNGTYEIDAVFCEEEELLKKQWTPKLYLHNTPHCIAAYLGSLIGVRYLHEAMTNPDAKDIVNGAMQEMLTALKLKWDIPHSFLEWYADKEIQRFTNKLLCDPVTRVAREPLRKLELEGRLIGAAQMCLELGFIPKNILIGIVSAILFESADDNDNHLSFMRKNIPPKILLTYTLGLREGEVLENLIENRFNSIVNRLDKLVANKNNNNLL